MESRIHIQPRVGEGIYTTSDVAKILNLDYSKVYRWMAAYWESELDENVQYTFGEEGSRAINFFSLIEFYTFFKLREKGVSVNKIKKLHKRLAIEFNTLYPFALATDIFVERDKQRENKVFLFYRHLGSLLKFDDRKQYSLDFIEEFLDKIDFDENNLASKFYPLAGSKNIVVDPRRQFGQPIIAGTNLKTHTVWGLYKGGESIEDISAMYNLAIEKIKDAITFQQAA